MLRKAAFASAMPFGFVGREDESELVALVYQENDRAVWQRYGEKLEGGGAKLFEVGETGEIAASKKVAGRFRNFAHVCSKDGGKPYAESLFGRHTASTHR